MGFPKGQNTDSEIKLAAEFLKQGELVAFPTETVYGLGADACNESAVCKIYTVKGRPPSNPLIVHLASPSEILNYTDLSKSFDPNLIRTRLKKLSALWPGPLSVVLPRAEGIAYSVSAGGSTLAFRIPNHPIALKLLRAFGGPIAAPSANPSEYISPTTAEHVHSALAGKVAYILDGGACSVGLESTVLSLIDPTPQILRPGAVTREQLETILETEIMRAASAVDKNTPLLSPGLLAKHYSPTTPVCFESDLTRYGELPKRVGVILFQPRDLSFSAVEVKTLSKDGHFEQIAAQIFSSLRELDKMGLDLIVVDTCEPIGMGEAIMDRLMRATA